MTEPEALRATLDKNCRQGVSFYAPNHRAFRPLKNQSFPMKLIIDHREPASFKTAIAQAAAGRNAVIETEELDSGDVLVAPSVAVERKTAIDFVQSIMDGRFVEQAAKLKGTYERVFWLLEGNPLSTSSQIQRDAVIGAQAYLAGLCGFSILRTESVAESAVMIVTLARHLQEGLGYEINLRPNKPKDPRTLSEFLVSGLPGVGGQKAKMLLSHFGSARAVFSQTAEKISEVDGFGGKSASRIGEVLDAKY